MNYNIYARHILGLGKEGKEGRKEGKKKKG
jgi:hypothetical protein